MLKDFLGKNIGRSPLSFFRERIFRVVRDGQSVIDLSASSLFLLEKRWYREL